MTNVEANLGRSPMKLYEYFAAGLQVVATRSPIIDNVQSKIFTYNSSLEGAYAVENALNSGLNIEGISESEKHDWSYIAKDLIYFIENI
jgi:hypothetical protein